MCNQMTETRNTIMKTINASQLKQRIDSGEQLVLLEILPRKYYDSGHLPGALHLPLVGLSARAATLLADKNAPIVTYCASKTCENSDIAARELAGLGYQNITVFAGGKEEWRAAGFPLVAETAPEPACACS